MRTFRIVGDITEIDHGIIIQQVNCQGKMGAGVAKVISDKWPNVKQSYLKYCRGKRSSDLLGDMDVVEVGPCLYVANLFGQLNLGRTKGVCYTDYNAQLNGLMELREWIDVHELHRLPIYYPKMGCVLGGGDWEIVANIINDVFSGLDHCLVEKE